MISSSLHYSQIEPVEQISTFSYYLSSLNVEESCILLLISPQSPIIYIIYNIKLVFNISYYSLMLMLHRIYCVISCNASKEFSSTYKEPKSNIVDVWLKKKT